MSADQYDGAGGGISGSGSSNKGGDSGGRNGHDNGHGSSGNSICCGGRRDGGMVAAEAVAVVAVTLVQGGWCNDSHSTGCDGGVTVVVVKVAVLRPW